MFSTREKTQRERDLEYELEGYRQAEERQQREQAQARQERDRERRARHEEQIRSASEWQDALRKQIYLCRREVGLIDDDTPPEQDFFEQSAQGCERALAIWKEVETARQVEIDALQARLAAVQKEIQNAVADQLESERSNDGWRNVAYAIRNQSPEEFLNW